jgi:2-keto-3-deoxy-L-rhamnonate aldolase RhmA
MCVFGDFIPAFPRLAADAGFDCVWLDLEHRLTSEREVQSLLAYFHLADIDCLLRPPTLEKTRLYRYLEDGATGLMIPHVSTAEKARTLVEAVKFPPLGDRGFDGAGLDTDFSLRGDGDYTNQANNETFLVVQIETPQAIANVDEIAAVEGVEAMFVGPADLGLRIKNDPESSMTLDDAMQTVAAAAQKHGKAWGCPAATLDRMKQLHTMGARLLAHGSEFSAIKQMLNESAENFDKATGE